MRALKEEGIASEIYYPTPMHQQECFAGKCRVVGSLRGSEIASQSVLALPIYPELTHEMLVFVAKTVCDVFQNVHAV